MIDVLVMRLDGPLMAFGGVVVDNVGVVRAFPAASMIVGLLGNSLGWNHGAFDRLERLQARLRFAARLDRPGSPLVDFQTAELGKDDASWTTRGQPEKRTGGADTYDSPHVRERHYRADALCTVVLALDPPAEEPTLDRVEQALDTPARPLFLGRKSCLPAAPLALGHLRVASLLDALQQVPLARGVAVPHRGVLAQWPAEEGGLGESRLLAICDERDWHNQIHVGERLVYEGLLHGIVEGPEGDSNHE